MVTNMGLNLLFVGLLLFGGFEGPHAGLALASSVAAYLNAMLLYRGLRKRAGVFAGTRLAQVMDRRQPGLRGDGCPVIFHDTRYCSWHQASAAVRVKNLTLSIAFGVIIYVFICMVAGLKTHDLVRGAK